MTKSGKSKHNQNYQKIGNMLVGETDDIILRGRPSKFKTEYCEMLIEHMAKGLSFESFAGLLQISKDTLYEWSNAHVKFSEAKRIGFERNRLFWEDVGVRGAIGEIKNFNATTYIFNKKNRFPQEWRDRQEIQQVNTISPVVIELDDGKQVRLEMKENQNQNLSEGE